MWWLQINLNVKKKLSKQEGLWKEETIKFKRWREGMALTPTIRAMRDKIETICDEELQRTLAKMSAADDDSREQLEKMVKAIAAKVLHDPLLYLKNNDCESSNKKKDI